ncbi:hypothetical protein [Paenibacillus illinoisensis]|uniref:hypothetical protein n=1 Tax=Paenibacillus illinoisensis TaxID=59845 RepID=UPI002040BCB3|nr:hypothetical protein [Paenibacillus illinoisensis]MCM3205631.1 hypothetical protein [Paenibacillus illinoisensis]
MLNWQDANVGQRPNEVVLMTDGEDIFLGYFDDCNEEWVSCYGEDEYGEITHFAEINLPAK